MSNNINNAVISGNLVKDAEIKELTNINVINFTIASNYSFKNSEGEYESKADFVNVKRYGKNLEKLAEIMKKGTGVVVVGAIKTDAYEVEGVKKYSTYILAKEIQVGEKKSGNNDTTITETPAKNTSEVSSSEDSKEEMPF